MPPRGFTNPAPKTESARSALNSFTCSLCNKSYSRHPEYEAHIGSYDHQHRKRLQDLKQLSRDPNAAERARKAEKKADAEAGLKKLGSTAGGSNQNNDNDAAAVRSSSSATTGGGGGFKKGGFKSSFTSVKGGAPAAPAGGRKNVLGDDEDEDAEFGEAEKKTSATAAPALTAPSGSAHRAGDVESDTDDEYGYQNDGDGAYYDPSKPTGCNAGCPSLVPA